MIVVCNVTFLADAPVDVACGLGVAVAAAVDVAHAMDVKGLAELGGGGRLLSFDLTRATKSCRKKWVSGLL